MTRALPAVTDTLPIPGIDPRYRVWHDRTVWSWAMPGKPSGVETDQLPWSDTPRLLSRQGGKRVRLRTLSGKMCDMASHLAYSRAVNAVHPSQLPPEFGGEDDEEVAPEVDLEPVMEALRRLEERVEALASRVQEGGGGPMTPTADGHTFKLWAYIAGVLVDCYGAHSAAAKVGVGKRALQRWASGDTEPKDEHHNNLLHSFAVLYAARFDVDEDEIEEAMQELKATNKHELLHLATTRLE